MQAPTPAAPRNPHGKAAGVQTGYGAADCAGHGRAPAAAGCAENPTAEASNATAVGNATIRHATGRAHTIPALTDIPRPSSHRPPSGQAAKAPLVVL
jgi:hypothetical protein